MKTTLKYGIATAKIKDSTSIVSIESNTAHMSFTVVYKSNPDVKYIYRYDDTSIYMFALTIMSTYPSAGKFVADLKNTAKSVWKINPGETVGQPIK